MRERQPGDAGVTLIASDRDVDRCPALRTDRDIQQDIANVLWSGGLAVPESALSLSVTDGVVNLSGHTRSPRETRAALAKAWTVPGVMGVLSDRLDDDETLTLVVAQALTMDAGTRAAHLLVRVRLGAVELDGRVPSTAVHSTATALAAAVPGVTRVRNGAVVTPTPAAIAPRTPPTTARPAALDWVTW